MEIFRRGDEVEITVDGRTVEAEVTLASPNGRSLIVAFEAMLDGHLGNMALSYDPDRDGFIGLMSGTPVELKRKASA